MGLIHLLLVLLSTTLLTLLFLSGSETSEVDVCYGRVPNDLPDLASVVQLLKQNGIITVVRIYDANPTVVGAFAGTGIKQREQVALPNEDLAAAANPAYARQWVQSNVNAYMSTTLITGIHHRNEVFNQQPQLISAMKNVQAALAGLGLVHTMKVTTPITSDTLKPSPYPPSAGEFRDNIARSVMSPTLNFHGASSGRSRIWHLVQNAKSPQ